MNLTLQELRQNKILAFCTECGSQAKFTPKTNTRMCASFRCDKCGATNKFYRQTIRRPQPTYVHVGKLKPKCCGASMNSVWIYNHTRQKRIGWLCRKCKTVWLDKALKLNGEEEKQRP